MTNGNQNSLQWIWAYSEQLNLLDKHDAYWIHCARSGWKHDGGLEDFRQMLQSYGVLRGKVASFLKNPNNLRQFLSLSNELYLPKLKSNALKDADERWMKMKKRFHIKASLVSASATLKIFWFYHPQKLPMYDAYARRGLHLWSGQKVDHNNFLTLFEAFAKESKSNIQDIEKYFNRKYLSYPRVAEKFLWLEGSGKKENILRNFQISLKLSPLP